MLTRTTRRPPSYAPRRVPARLAATAFAVATTAAAITYAPASHAGSFDALGVYHPSPLAQVFLPFDNAPERFVPPDIEEACLLPQHVLITGEDAVANGGALVGDSFVRLTSIDCQERFVLPTPAQKASYQLRAWTRHGILSARAVVSYPEDAGLDLNVARMFPTGRTTSDGWMEIASNDFPVDGTLDPLVYIRLSNSGAVNGVDVDAIELVRSGTFEEPQITCDGVDDPVCGDEGLCSYGVCQLPRLGMPPLPDESIRDGVVDVFAGMMRTHFGGRKTRLEDMPTAIATLEEMRTATSAHEFWNLWGRAFRELHDWHTSASLSVNQTGPERRLNVCFIEGNADLSQSVEPTDPELPDVLVSHTGFTSAGLKPGDRLIAVDGEHPIRWARNLIEVDWGYQIASADDVHAEFVEALGGPYWIGGALILQYASTFTVLHCDPNTSTCDATPETINVTDLPFSFLLEQDVACDNRPTYHLGADSPDANNHYIFGQFFRGRVDDTTPEEAIFGMVFDSLSGGGVPGSNVNVNIANAIIDWKANARGAILDHRAGSGGTLDSPELLTRLVRPQEVASVQLMPMVFGGYDGPETVAEGLALFDEWKDVAPYTVGASDHDPDLPVALLLHRDGSASDYLPFGMKGAPNVRLFGGTPATAGAFSTFVSFYYPGGMFFQLASGDTYSSNGTPLIGEGVTPDEVVRQKQSDLLLGKDSVHEAALAWVRQELKPL